MARSIPRKIIYLLIAWILMVSYQIFTRTALITLASSFKGSAPSVASLISSNAGTTAFVCSFAWMFILSALISIIMFGKERRLTIQFLITLVLTLISSALLGLLSTVGLELANPNFLAKSADLLFGNVFFSFFYLALPFIFMIAVDLKWMKIKK